MPYMNKRNRFIASAKTYAEMTKKDISAFTKADLLTIAHDIGMKGIPTWVLKDYRSAVSKGVYDLTTLLGPVVL